MDKKAAKNALATSFEKGEQEAFNESLANYLEFIDSKEEFNEFVEFITFHAVRDMINDESLLKKVRYFVKDKIFELLLNRGDTPSSKHIALYSIFKGSPHIEDERLDKYIAFADANATNKDLGDMEKMYLIYLRFVLSFIRGDDDSLVVFFKWLLTLNIHKVELPGEEIAVREFLSKLKDLDIGEVFKALDELFDVDHYFSLSTGERRSIYNWCLHTLWNIPRLFNDRRWVEMYPKWKTLLYKHLELDEIDQAMYLQFYIYHKMGNSFQTQKEWKMFNDEISRVTAKYYREWAEKNSLPQAKIKESEGKKLIGIIKDRIVENSPFKVEYSMLKQVMKDEEFKSKYDVKIYNMSYIEKSLNYDQQVSELRSLGIDILDAHQPFYGDGYYFSHLQKALYLREKIISDGVDVAIFPISGYDISDFLVSTRVAPKQIFWSHGNFEYDIDGIDKRITHISDKSHRIESGYEYEFFDVESDEKYLGLEEEKYKEEADKVRSRFDEGTVILGSIGRLVKVDSKEYLEAVAKVMHECPNTVYLACGVGNVDSIKAQVEELGIADRFYFEGWIDPDVYGYVIDVYLDTFPESGGQSVLEWGRKNKTGVVNLKKKVLIHESDLNHRKEHSIFGISLNNNYIVADNYILDALDLSFGLLGSDDMFSDLEFEDDKTVLTMARNGYAYSDDYLNTIDYLLENDKDAVFVAITFGGEKYLKRKVSAIKNNNRFFIVDKSGIEKILSHRNCIYINGKFGLSPQITSSEIADRGCIFLSIPEIVDSKKKTFYKARKEILVDDISSKKEAFLDSQITYCKSMFANYSDTIDSIHSIREACSKGTASAEKLAEQYIEIYNKELWWKRFWKDYGISDNDRQNMIDKMDSISFYEYWKMFLNILLRDKYILKSFHEKYVRKALYENDRVLKKTEKKSFQEVL